MSELEEQIKNRRQKRQEMVAAGIEPYPSNFDHDMEPASVHQQFDEMGAEDLVEKAIRMRVPGRVKGLRNHGKTSFLDLYDGQAKLQVMARTKDLDETSANLLQHLDLGDYLGVEGQLIRTRTGELTLLANRLSLLAKALRPLPEKWHGLADVETRYRQRYLDLVVNPESRQVFERRIALLREIRRFFDQRDFLEVETPMMQPIAGGATARPFVTHHNALDIDLFLRVAPELYLKRLLVGGLHKVYEINRNFRNEGISTQHNPEFTMLEFYWAYVGYEQLMELTEELITGLAQGLLGKAELQWKGEALDLTSPWPRYTMKEAIGRFAGIDEAKLDHPADLAFVFGEREIDLPPVIKDRDHPVLKAGSSERFDSQHGDLEVPASWYGYLLQELFEQTVEQELSAPTFITHYPIAVSPLAKPDPYNPGFTLRFELFMGGMEIANGFSELNDPDLQAERFRQQLAAREQGDEEAHRFDDDYIRALEHGMPPAGGEGIGIDRLAMLLTDSASIRDVILFPLLRPDTRDERI